MRLSKIKKFCCIMMSLVLVAGLFGINSGVSDVKASESTNNQTRVYAGSELTIQGVNASVSGTTVTKTNNWPQINITLPNGGVYATQVTVTLKNKLEDYTVPILRHSSCVKYENNAQQMHASSWALFQVEKASEASISWKVGEEYLDQKVTTLHLETNNPTSMSVEIVSVTVTLSSVVREITYAANELTYSAPNATCSLNGTELNITYKSSWPQVKLSLPSGVYARDVRVNIKNNADTNFSFSSSGNWIKDENGTKVGTAGGSWTIPASSTASIGWNIDVDSLATMVQDMHFQTDVQDPKTMNLTITGVTVTLSNVVRGHSYLGSELEYKSVNQSNITEAPKITYTGAWAKFCINLPKAVYASSVTVTMKSSTKTVSILNDANTQWLYGDGTNSYLGKGGQVNTSETSITYRVPEEYQNKKISGIQIAMSNVTSGESIEILSVVVNDMLNDDVTMLMDNLKDATNCYDAISTYEDSSNLVKKVISSRINPYSAIAIPTLNSSSKITDSEYLNGRLALNASVEAPAEAISQVGILVTPSSKLNGNSLTLDTVETVEAGTMSQESPNAEGVWESVLISDNDYSERELTAVSYVQYNDGVLTVYSTGEIVSGGTSVVAGTTPALTTYGAAAPTQTTWQIGNVVTDNTDIDVVDLVRLMKYVDESYTEEVTIHYAQSDVNVDGVIDKNDISKLREGLCGNFEWPLLPYAGLNSIKKDWTLE